MLVPIQTAPQQPIDHLPDLKDVSLAGAWLNKATARDNLGTDYSAAGDDMVPVGAPTKERVGADFDGAADYLRRAEANWRSADHQGTIIAWIKTTVAGNYGIFASYDESANNRYFLFRVRATNYIEFLQVNAVVLNSMLANATLILPGQWYRVAIVSDESSYHMYINGEIETFTVGSGSDDGKWLADTDNRDSIVIGIRNPVAGVSYYFNGEIHGVRYYSEEKSADWFKHDYQLGVPDDSLLLYVLDGTRDLSRYERALVRGGGVVTGHDMEFDGVDDVIDCGDLGNVQTIMGWVRPGTITEEIWLVDAGNDVMVSGGTVTYTGLTPVATYVNGVAGTTMAAGVWQHLACVVETVDANNFELGTDGANFGATRQRDVKVFSEIKAADFIRAYYLKTRGFY